MIGPEAPLVAGAADALREDGFACFGPDAGAARIEGSKSFAKQVMAAAGIPTAASRTCTTRAEADEALAAFGPPYVVKDDALAAGKGVVVTTDLQAARAHASACGTVVIEEFLDGPEVSLFAVTDGTTAVPLLPVQDFKRARDGDLGPNTGGMGAYAPLPWAPPDLAERMLDTVIQPAVDALRRRGLPYRGLLYAGLCLTAAGPRVVEFNARFGDPETQVVLDRLASPLAPLLHAAAVGDLAGTPAPRWHPGAAVTVVIAAEGYPEHPVPGEKITIPYPERAVVPSPAMRGKRGTVRACLRPACRDRHGRGRRPVLGRRPGAERRRVRRRRRRRARRGLRPGRHDSDARRLVPPRHRGLPGGWPRRPGRGRRAWRDQSQGSDTPDYVIERYTLPEMGRVWSEAHKYELWCRVRSLSWRRRPGRVPYPRTPSGRCARLPRRRRRRSRRSRR